MSPVSRLSVASSNGWETASEAADHADTSSHLTRDTGASATRGRRGRLPLRLATSPRSDSTTSPTEQMLFRRLTGEEVRSASRSRSRVSILSRGLRSSSVASSPPSATDRRGGPAFSEAELEKWRKAKEWSATDQDDEERGGADNDDDEDDLMDEDEERSISTQRQNAITRREIEEADAKKARELRAVNEFIEKGLGPADSRPSQPSSTLGEYPNDRVRGPAWAKSDALGGRRRSAKEEEEHSRRTGGAEI